MEGLPAPAWASQLVKDSAGFVTLPTEAIINQFAQDLPVAEARLVAATQGPWSSKCPGEKVTNAAWHNKPSWDVVTEDDKMISPKLQETMAERIGATVTRVNSSHVVMLSKPEIVAAAIMNAANSIK
jgi:pimeloyl-ACP methyl ester carboxylesterase